MEKTTTESRLHFSAFMCVCAFTGCVKNNCKSASKLMYDKLIEELIRKVDKVKDEIDETDSKLMHDFEQLNSKLKSLNSNVRHPEFWSKALLKKAMEKISKIYEKLRALTNELNVIIENLDTILDSPSYANFSKMEIKVEKIAEKVSFIKKITLD